MKINIKEWLLGIWIIIMSFINLYFWLEIMKFMNSALTLLFYIEQNTKP